MKKIVLAFSGGLDTSFCIPYLIEQDFKVHTIFVNTGGTDAEDEITITNRAIELGATKHININVEEDLWHEIIKPLIWSGATYQNKYPALCSDRYLIVKEAVKLCNELDTDYIAHGCTGMGNDQVRFDLSIQSLGNFKIITPIREIQSTVSDVRNYEKDYLESKGFKVSSLHSKYSINVNLLGATASGSEIDEWNEPSNKSYILCNQPDNYPDQSQKISIEFSHGEAIAINEEPIIGSKLLKKLNEAGGQYGIGREIFTGDTIIGLKGRFLFEAPGLAILYKAHRALEESLLTREQNTFKPSIGQKWIDLVYSGLYFDPLVSNLEVFLEDIQTNINGKVDVVLSPGKVDAVAVHSDHILISTEGAYAQSANWGVEEAAGFIKLYGQSTGTWTSINKK
ncbi:MAG: argininosuccinate synthase [Gammaproteobacteria bacterium]|jgi:argininosuccinate synthase|nr:argininosuccinate synthase [Gammaproteobacteria bacterium]